MKTLTRSQLVAKIAEINGNAFVGVEALTDAKAKKSNPFGTIFKQSRAVVSVGANYENGVNNQGEREGNAEAGEFQAQPLPWGEWMIPNKIISHKGELYLRTQTAPRQRKARPAIVRFRDANGHFLSFNDVQPHLPVKAPSARQAAFGNKGEVQVRNFNLSNILKIRLGGETFRVIE